MFPQTFPQFTKLPPEIRAMIWELCLPKRLIRLSSLVIANSHHYYPEVALDPTIEKLLKFVFSRKCIISQVCRESRAVATLCRVPVVKLDLPWLGCSSWFDPRTDTLILDCDVFWSHKSLWLQLRKVLFPGHGTTNRVRLAVVKDLGNWYFNHLARITVDPDQEFRKGEEDLLPPIRQTSWPVEMKEVYLNPPMRAVAIASGWAGPTGEAACRHVEVCYDGPLERLERLTIPYAMDMPAARTMVKEGLDKWEKDYSHLLIMSRALGFEGSEKEWRKTGKGPYPVFTMCMCDWKQW
ncbi:hypothetical protein P885DRAFT_80887 [Corynascus similis CBS 632.67]